MFVTFIISLRGFGNYRDTRDYILDLESKNFHIETRIELIEILIKVQGKLVVRFRQAYGKLETSIVQIANVPVEMVGPFLSRNWLLMAESQGDPGRQIWSTNLQNGYNFNLASSLAVILKHYIKYSFDTEPLFSYIFFHTSYSILTIRKVPFRKLLRSLTLVFFNTEVKWKTSFF